MEMVLSRSWRLTIFLRKMAETEHRIARIDVTNIPQQRQARRLRYRHCHREKNRSRRPKGNSIVEDVYEKRRKY